MFETWHLGDGNYPALKKGQLVNLSFELQPEVVAMAENSAAPEFHHLGQAEYRFTGFVLRVYREADPSEQIVVVEADRFRFYINSPAVLTLQRGDLVSGSGTLALDHYIWVEFLPSYVNAPDLFYTLQVTDICRCRIPERFIVRSGLNSSGPTRVRPDEYGPGDVTHVDTVSDEEWVNYVVCRRAGLRRRDSGQANTSNVPVLRGCAAWRRRVPYDACSLCNSWGGEIPLVQPVRHDRGSWPL